VFFLGVVKLAFLQGFFRDLAVHLMVNCGAFCGEMCGKRGGETPRLRRPKNTPPF
jgi:hypothetical protein